MSQFAPCPRCGSVSATPVGFSWWGGVLGPKMLTHVKCGQCRATYNGKTGAWNTVGIAIYITVTTVIALVIGGYVWSRMR